MGRNGLEKRTRADALERFPAPLNRQVTIATTTDATSCKTEYRRSFSTRSRQAPERETIAALLQCSVEKKELLQIQISEARRLGHASGIVTSRQFVWDL